jgi:hypothetical protein
VVLGPHDGGLDFQRLGVGIVGRDVEVELSAFFESLREDQAGAVHRKVGNAAVDRALAVVADHCEVDGESLAPAAGEAELDGNDVVELVGAHWRDEHLVAPGLGDTAHLAGVDAFAHDEHDATLGPLLDLAGDVVPGDLVELGVEDRQIGVVALHGLHCVAAVRAHQHFEPEASERSGR